jgi:hypothetical protein
VLGASLALRVILLLAICGATAPACGEPARQLLSPRQIARQVGTYYGDPRAVVVRSQSDWTEADRTPMYLMTIAGQLRLNGVPAATVAFSALATRLYVWDIRAFDAAGQQVWTEREWAPASPGPVGPSTPLQPPSDPDPC